MGYLIQLPRILTVKQKFKGVRLGRTIPNMYNDFEPENIMEEEIPTRVDLLDILKVFTSGQELVFLDREQIPYLYEDILVNIEAQERKIHSMNFKPELLSDLYDLGEYLFQTYNLRLTEYFHIKEFGNTANAGLSFTDGISLQDVTLNPITRKI